MNNFKQLFLPKMGPFFPKHSQKKAYRIYDFFFFGQKLFFKLNITGRIARAPRQQP
jgi:hypothetical protein